MRAAGLEVVVVRPLHLELERRIDGEHLHHVGLLRHLGVHGDPVRPAPVLAGVEQPLAQVVGPAVLEVEEPVERLDQQRVWVGCRFEQRRLEAAPGVELLVVERSFDERSQGVRAAQAQDFATAAA